MTRFLNGVPKFERRSLKSSLKALKVASKVDGETAFATFRRSRVVFKAEAPAATQEPCADDLQYDIIRYIYALVTPLEGVDYRRVLESVRAHCISQAQRLRHGSFKRTAAFFKTLLLRLQHGRGLNRKAIVRLLKEHLRGTRSKGPCTMVQDCVEEEDADEHGEESSDDSVVCTGVFAAPTKKPVRLTDACDSCEAGACTKAQESHFHVGAIANLIMARFIFWFYGKRASNRGARCFMPIHVRDIISVSTQIVAVVRRPLDGKPRGANRVSNVSVAEPTEREDCMEWKFVFHRESATITALSLPFEDIYRHAMECAESDALEPDLEEMLYLPSRHGATLALLDAVANDEYLAYMISLEST